MVPINFIRNPRPTNWYDSIPVAEDPVKKWANFDASKLKGNEIQCSAGTMAKIPQLQGFISRKKRTDEYGNVTTYIELITERWYDKEKRQTRNKRVCIGIDVSMFYGGMMLINDKYHDYFDKDGNLLITIRDEGKKKDAADKKTAEKDKGEEKKDAGDCLERQQAGTEAEENPVYAEDSAEKRQEVKQDMEAEEKKQEATEENDSEIQEEINRKDHMKDRFEFLDRLLLKYRSIIEEQVTKRPDMRMSRYQIIRINQLLKEIREFLQIFEYGEYMPLAEEPEEEGETMTYADMALLLLNYDCVMNSYRIGRIWYKSCQ